MQTIVESYASDEGNGKYPLASNDATNTTSVASVMQSHGINWTGDSKGITDPWKTPYRYNSNDNGYIIVSAGKDKTFGTSDDIYVGNYTDGIQNGVPSSSQNSNLVIDINYIMQNGYSFYIEQTNSYAYAIVFHIPKNSGIINMNSSYPSYIYGSDDNSGYIYGSDDNSGNVNPTSNFSIDSSIGDVYIGFMYYPPINGLSINNEAIMFMWNDPVSGKNNYAMYNGFIASESNGTFGEDIKFTFNKDISQYVFLYKNHMPAGFGE